MTRRIAAIMQPCALHRRVMEAKMREWGCCVRRFFFLFFLFFGRSLLLCRLCRAGSSACSEAQNYKKSGLPDKSACMRSTSDNKHRFPHFWVVFIGILAWGFNVALVMFALLCWTIFVSLEGAKLPLEFSGKKKNSTWPCFQVIFPESDIGISTFHKHSIIHSFRNWLSMLHPHPTPSQFRHLLAARNTRQHRAEHSRSGVSGKSQTVNRKCLSNKDWCVCVSSEGKGLIIRRQALSELSSPALGIVKCAVNGARLGARDLANARRGWL